MSALKWISIAKLVYDGVKDLIDDPTGLQELEDVASGNYQDPLASAVTGVVKKPFENVVDTSAVIGPPILGALNSLLSVFENQVIPNLSEEEQERFAVKSSDSSSLSEIEQATDPEPTEPTQTSPEAIQEFLEQQVSDGQMTPQEAQQMLMGYVGPSEPPRNEALVTDIEYVNQPGGGDIVSTGFDPLGRDGTMSIAGYMPEGTIGLKDQAYFNVFAPFVTEESDEMLIGTATKVDRDMESKGFEFRRVVDEDRPFTIKDGMNLYDQQPDKSKRLVAESLVPAMMQDAGLRALLMRNPEMIYDRESIFIALTNIQGDAAYQASLMKDSPTSSGFEDLDMIPALTEAELGFEDPFDSGQFGSNRQSMSLKNLTDVLFNEAVAMGTISTVTKAYSDKAGGDIYRQLTGRAPDDAFFVLNDLWTREAQMEKAAQGQGSLSGGEYAAMYESNIRSEYADEIQHQTSRTARDSLLRGMRIK